MKKNALMRVTVAGLMLLLIQSGFSQTVYTHAVVTVNSGKFEFAPPFNDFVNLGRYNPASQVYENSGTIWTQSAQDILIHGRYAYVAAQDSLVKYDIGSWSRVAAIADSGLNKLCLYQNRLIVSKQYPVTKYFVEVLDTTNLGLIARVAGIAGECAGITAMNDSVYVAVNGGWMGTEGKLAVIDPTDWSLETTYVFGSAAIGIFNLYSHDGKIFSINKTPYGAPAEGTITEFDPQSGNFTNHLLPVTVGNGSGIKDSNLFLRMNGGLGCYNLTTNAISDTIVIADPGSSQFLSILSVGVDTAGNRLYTNIGDYSTPGFCLVTDLEGDSITSYQTGVSSECIAFDYRQFPLAVETQTGLPKLNTYPNPAFNQITIQITGEFKTGVLTLLNNTGRVLLSRQVDNGTKTFTLPVSHLASGIYLIRVETDTYSLTERFIKK